MRRRFTIDNKIISMCLDERKKKLEDINKEIENAQIDLNKADFEEQMYSLLKRKTKYTKEYEEKYSKSVEVVDQLDEKIKRLKKNLEIISTEIEFIEKNIKE